VGNELEKDRKEAVFMIWSYCLRIGRVYFSNVCMFGM